MENDVPKWFYETLSRYVNLEIEIRRNELLVILEKVLTKYGESNPALAKELTAILLDRWKSLDD